MCINTLKIMIILIMEAIFPFLDNSTIIPFKFCLYSKLNNNSLDKQANYLTNENSFCIMQICIVLISNKNPSLSFALSVDVVQI